jgi:hypothetical protein
MIFLKLQKLGKKVSQLALLVIAAVKMFIVSLFGVRKLLSSWMNFFKVLQSISSDSLLS